MAKDSISHPWFVDPNYIRRSL